MHFVSVSAHCGERVRTQPRREGGGPLSSVNVVRCARAQAGSLAAGLSEVDAAVTLVQAWESQKAAAGLAEKLKAAEAQRLREVSSLNITVSDREKDLALLRSQLAELASKAQSTDANLVSMSGILKEQVDDLQKQLADLESQLKALVAEKAQWTALSEL